MKKNVFITGGAGFIGSHLIEKLVKLNFNVKALVPYNVDNSWGWIDTFDKKILNNVEVIQGDISDSNLIRREIKGCNLIFNLAALISIPYSYKSSFSYVNSNIIGSLNFLEAIRDINLDLYVQTSTSEVYGSAQYIPIDEKHPLNAQSPYAATKIASDQLALSFERTFKLPITVIRPFNNFGPRQSLRAVIPTIINQCLSDKKYINLGNLKARRDFLYVDDCVDGFIKCIKNKKKCIGKTINLSTNNDHSILKVVKEISLITGTKKKIILDKDRIRPKKSEVDLLRGSNNLAKKILGWEAKLSNKKNFRVALEKTVSWYKKNFHKFKDKTYNYNI